MEPVAVTIRHATASDASTLATLCAEHAIYERIDYQAAGHVERLSQALAANRLHAWLAFVDGAPVGYATATEDFSTLSGRPFLHMDCLYLKDDARNRGIGALLMQQLIELGQQLECANLQWQTPDWNSNAIRFYQRSGASQLIKARFMLTL